MPTQTIRHKQFLFVDDDPAFLAAITELFTAMAGGSWVVSTAENHAQALERLTTQRADVVVLDIGMPVMDGLQFLRLLGRTHPGQQVVMLTGHATPEARKTCLENGAVLFLEKPTSPDGFAAVFSALDALAGAQPQAGFRGMMRRVGLQEVLQMECLSRKSSVLEIFTGKVRGRIFIHDGSIVHADSGAVQGEVALYGLLALRGGDFNFLPFTEPPRRTIAGHWESLLMEAARLSDEGTKFFEADEVEAVPPPTAAAVATPELPAAPVASAAARPPPGFARTQEIVLCSGAGEVLFEWDCKSLERRLRLLEQIEQQAEQLSQLAPVGRLDRLEILSADGRIVCQVRPDRRLFVRAARPKSEAA